MNDSDSTYGSLLNSIDEGFCIIEVMFEGDRAVDYRFLEVNAAFEQNSGLVNVKGKLVSELAPGLEQHWFDFYGRVALTGIRCDRAASSGRSRRS